MESRSSRSSLVMMMILIPLTLDSMALSAVINADNNITKIYVTDVFNISKEFPCEDPQSRAYNLKDLLKNLLNDTGLSAEQPFYIKLKRCDWHSGCCPAQYDVCAPVKSKIYYEDMEIIISDVKEVEKKPYKHKWIRVEQHKECFCNRSTAFELSRLDHQRPNVTIL
ncbi:uncharacterized protein LOC143424455 [Xylocopa sonorina]|uniref:uncharacterized protein LOC143424455 n=1 Tax=Xylocopa sonorina TaxID=1818115 RepID=UPI00403B362E